ncbi:hypothetical protein M430DRAFT_14353 [Amorphotheca resinae ATCC 22711]|jgi:hypothetical protein|uniref:Uncharacterized protein n=1 Tax=Amorphotheca resinae ATCC 22711 TaxID=857342 RepID=A0A2T3BCC7_AMORE|nr:hypothetical protein M430DRAFT_14353 [Amorphotheca resinae ATCC 22711]PSS27045.1 hypothetical protein M430DRAFT_14353 [Amorphotheca resinae ATCC 22711]
MSPTLRKSTVSQAKAKSPAVKRTTRKGTSGKGCITKKDPSRPTIRVAFPKGIFALIISKHPEIAPSKRRAPAKRVKPVKEPIPKKVQALEESLGQLKLNKKTVIILKTSNNQVRAEESHVAVSAGVEKGLEQKATEVNGELKKGALAKKDGDTGAMTASVGAQQGLQGIPGLKEGDVKMSDGAPKITGAQAPGPKIRIKLNVSGGRKGKASPDDDEDR